MAAEYRAALLPGLVVLVIVTFALEAPASLLTGTRHAVRYFSSACCSTP